MTIGPPVRHLAVAACVCVCYPAPAPVAAQESVPTLRAVAEQGPIRLDGVLDEPAWFAADSIATLTMTDPVEGGVLTGNTVVRVLADRRGLTIGVVCYDPDPSKIVSFSKARDAELENEDHIKFVLDTFRDGRTGYVFAVNPNGARYDALVAEQGEGENADWDAVWEAAATRGAFGWSVEIRIPIQSLAFRAGLREWGFNIERRLQRLLETSRWASARRDFAITQTSRAGRLQELADFSLGVGLSVRPSLVTDVVKPPAGAVLDATVEPSLDVTQRLGPNTIASLTVRTDFAETEVDTRRTNLTRFPLFFPEKRTFFLEGADIFDFGLGLTAGFRGADLIAFQSRRIGLFEGQAVPIRLGAKVNGRLGNSNFGALAVQTSEVSGLVPQTEMSVVRFRQNILAESYVGMIATVGDPEGRSDSYELGVDFTYQTSRLGGSRNFLAGVWGLLVDRQDLSGDKAAVGFKVDYPNDPLDFAITYKRIGDAFDPSLGFVPRRGVQIWNPTLNYVARPAIPWVRTNRFQLFPRVVLDLDNQWESYRVFTAPVNVTFESGERFEFNVAPEGERLTAPFEVADSVLIQPGSYHWVRYRLEQDFAAKRRVSGRVTWWFGGFYDGSLHQIEVSALFKPSASASLELTGERIIGRLPAGDFTQSLVGARLLINFSPDLQLNSFVQYDDVSQRLGTNTRLRWTFHPLGDVFVVLNHNAVRPLDRWALEQAQFLVKAQYAFRL